MRSSKPVTYHLVEVVALLLLGCAVAAFCLYGPWWIGKLPSYDQTNGSIGQIALPAGYERVVDDGSGFADYLRSLPLAAEDVKVRLTTGEICDSLLPYAYRVVRLPLLHRYEQCADVCIRLRSEYLFRSRQFRRIHYDDTQYHTMRYYGGGSRSLFGRYLVHVFKYANTESLIHELPSRRLHDMRCGDVFVYGAKDREDKPYGHAVMVADVATNPATGRKIFLLLQGSTPACSIHLLNNNDNPAISPWFELDEKAQILDFGTAVYHDDELRYFDN